jgi:hypothetical protein
LGASNKHLRGFYHFNPNAEQRQKHPGIPRWNLMDKPQARACGAGIYPQDPFHQRQYFFAFPATAKGLPSDRRAADPVEKPLAADEKGSRG